MSAALQELVNQSRPFASRPPEGHKMPANQLRVAPVSHAEEEIAPPENSDVALASAFVVRGLPSFRWTHAGGWMAFDGVVWKRDDRLQRYALARRVCCDAALLTDDEAEGKRLASAKTINAVLTVAQADQQLVVPVEDWDRDPLLLNTPEGIFDLRAQTMLARDAEYVTQAARVSPDFSQACPVWERFLDAIFIGDKDLISFMQRSLGYSITGDRREQVLWFWYGLGANGKSVLAELVQWIAGSYTLKLAASVLMQAKGERHPTELAQLRGKRLAISSEIDENCFFNESLIKELTGDGTLSARFMRGDFFEFPMSQKHIIVGNYKPRLRGGDPALGRRMLLVPFNASFKGADRDPLMLEKLKAEAPGVLAWIIRGAAAWSRDGLQVPALVRDASSEYLADHDDTQQWMDERCQRDGEERASALYQSFSFWKKAGGEHAPSQTIWSTRLATMPGITKRKSNGIRYAGISLIDSGFVRSYEDEF